MYFHTPGWQLINGSIRWPLHEVIGRVAENESLLFYRKTSNIRRTLSGYEIVDHSDVVGASPVGAAPTTSSFST